MKKLPFTGCAVAIVTPFIGNEVDYDSFGKLIDFHIAHKTDAIVVCGTTGEASTMPSDEHMSVVEYAVKKVNKRIPLIAGTGSNDTLHAIEMTKKAQEVGADALLCVTPYYNKANKNGLIRHYENIASSTTLPIILYNVPSRTGMSIDISILSRLAKIPNIVAIKEASGNISYATQIGSKIDDLYIYSGNDDIIVPMMSIGAKGVISVAANIYPNEIHDICEYCLDGDFKNAWAVQKKMYDIISAFFMEVNPIPVKTAMNYLGFSVGNLRLPLGKMEEEHYKKLIEAIENYK